jgi:hypothetical protein
MTTATSGVLARFPLLLPVRNSFASYGASAVTRTSDRGHLAEARDQGHRSGGVSIWVSKETFLLLNVHWCSVHKAARQVATQGHPHDSGAVRRARPHDRATCLSPVQQPRDSATCNAGSFESLAEFERM